jgi:5-methylcytosine-specific restriction protein B
VFRTVFHQNSKYRDFVTGLVPKVGTSGAAAFTVTQGTLYRASEFAKSEGAALLIVDEINRGPAIQIFGGSIAAIESDKRLNPDGSPHANTQPFELLGLDGETVEYSLPHDLYLLAAMNQADTSVEPLDVAFLRRWAPYRLEPAVSVLAAHLGVDLPLPSPLPTTPESAPDVYAAAIAAWEAVNRRISLGRGAEYQIGHGVMMLRDRPEGSSVSDALEYIDESWQLISSHIDEVFFGDTRGIAAVLNVGPESGSHPYRLEDVVFADEPRVEIVGPRPIPQGKLYALLRAIAGS